MLADTELAIGQLDPPAALGVHDPQIFILRKEQPAAVG